MTVGDVSNFIKLLSWFVEFLFQYFIRPIYQYFWSFNVLSYIEKVPMNVKDKLTKHLLTVLQLNLI